MSDATSLKFLWHLLDAMLFNHHFPFHHDPHPPPPPHKDPSMPTIGDLIQAELAAAADQSTKADAAAMADAALAASNSALTTADASLSAGLFVVGPAFTIDTATNTVRVFLPDNSKRGFHELDPVGVDTPLPVVPQPPAPPAPPADTPPAPDA